MTNLYFSWIPRRSCSTRYRWLLSKLNYNERECFVNNWRRESDRNLNFFLLERRHSGTFIWMKSDWSTNGPIRWILARDFENHFSGLDFVQLKVVNTPFDRESFYLSNKLLLSVPSGSVQELSWLWTGRGRVCPQIDPNRKSTQNLN